MELGNFRSKLEVNWHEELEKLGIAHQYEAIKISMKIDGIETSYTPDFVLPGQGMVIEVKGNHPWEGKSMQKTRMLAKMGYSVLKCTSEGKFNFIGNDSDTCFILQCPSCSQNFFGCDKDEPCPFCSDDSIKQIIHDGRTGIAAWSSRRKLEQWLFDQNSFDQISNTLSDDGRKMYTNVYEKLCGVPKRISYSRSMIQQLDDLFKKYPNMNEVRQFFFSIIDTLPIRIDKTISFPPILFEGSPGCGKTSFATEFAKIVAFENYRKIDLSNGICGFTISGSDRGFTRAEPGLILQSMYSDGFAPVKNPLIILDEINKCSKNNHTSETVFHTLLERTSAKVFTDNFFGIPVDASKVNYIALCNDSSAISRSILDRFKHFKIRDYTEEELRDTVIPTIYDNWLKDERINPSRVPRELSIEYRNQIVKRSLGRPRRVIPLLNEFLGKSLYTDPDTQKTISLFTPKEYCRWTTLCGQSVDEVAETDSGDILTYPD